MFAWYYILWLIIDTRLLCLYLLLELYAACFSRGTCKVIPRLPLSVALKKAAQAAQEVLFLDLPSDVLKQLAESCGTGFLWNWSLQSKQDPRYSSIQSNRGLLLMRLFNRVDSCNDWGEKKCHPTMSSSDSARGALARRGALRDPARRPCRRADKDRLRS